MESDAVAVSHDSAPAETPPDNSAVAEQALAEAQSAIAVAPDYMLALMALGEAQKALQKNADARVTFERALTIARSMEPTAQEVWIPRVQEKLAKL